MSHTILGVGGWGDEGGTDTVGILPLSSLTLYVCMCMFVATYTRRRRRIMPFPSVHMLNDAHGMSSNVG